MHRRDVLRSSGPAASRCHNDPITRYDTDLMGARNEQMEPKGLVDGCCNRYCSEEAHSEQAAWQVKYLVLPQPWSYQAIRNTSLYCGWPKVIFALLCTI